MALAVRSNTEGANFNVLPQRATKKIFSFLYVFELLDVSKVSRRLHDLSWRAICKKRFPLAYHCASKATVKNWVRFYQKQSKGRGLEFNDPTIPLEVLEHILMLAGDPFLVRKVQRSWNVAIYSGPLPHLVKSFESNLPPNRAQAIYQRIFPEAKLSDFEKLRALILYQKNSLVKCFKPEAAGSIFQLFSSMDRLDRFCEIEKIIIDYNLLLFCRILPSKEIATIARNAVAKLRKRKNEAIKKPKTYISFLKRQAFLLRNLLNNDTNRDLATDLICTSSRLTQLPPEIALFPGLIRMYLDGNQLIDLPNEMRCLKELEILFLSNNRFSYLPSVINELAIRSLDLSKNNLRNVNGVEQITTLQFLSFSFNPLNNLPVLNLDNLKSLKFKKTNIKSFPTSMTSITHLFIRCARLTKVPAEIKELPHLRVLHLRSNRLRELPNEIEGLRDLTYLCLMNNEFTSFPKVICNLTALQVLALCNNQLAAIPEELGSMRNLRAIYIKNNEIESLPSAMGRLSNLEKIILCGNKLKEIPVSFTELKQLTCLYARKNQLEKFPILGRNLAMLSLKENNLEQFPIGRYPFLWQLDLSNNPLRELAPNIGALKALSELILQSTQLSVIPDEIEACKRMQKLNLSQNQLANLPEGISKLTQLKVLDLKANFFNRFPLELTKLSELRTLDIRDNKLEALPKSFSNLTKLRYLVLANNRLLSLPPKINNLSNLTLLDVTHNPLSEVPKSLRHMWKLTKLYLNRDIPYTPGHQRQLVIYTKSNASSEKDDST